MKNFESASVSHDEALVRELRNDPDFAAEYLQAAMEDTDEPAVLLIELRHVSEAFGRPMSPRLRASSGKASTGPCRPKATRRSRP